MEVAVGVHMLQTSAYPRAATMLLKTKDTPFLDTADLCLA